MAIDFHRSVVIPLWAVAFFVVVLNAPPHVMPSLIALLGIAVAGSIMPPIVRWLRDRAEGSMFFRQGIRRRRMMITADTRTRTVDEAIDADTTDTDDAADLVRLDDDGGRQTIGFGARDGR